MTGGFSHNYMISNPENLYCYSYRNNCKDICSIMAYGNRSPICEMEDEWIEVSDEGSSLVDEWVFVEGGVNGLPTVVELAQEGTYSGGINTKSYCSLCSVMPKDLIQLFARMSGRAMADLLIVNICQTSETQARKQDFQIFLSQLVCDVQARDERSDALAERVKEVLMGTGIRNVRQKSMLMRADDGIGTHSTVDIKYISDIALCYLSVQGKRDATFHYNLGKALASLKHEGVVILCACNNKAPTNLQISSPPLIWTELFDQWLTSHLLQKSFEEIVQFEKTFPRASNGDWLAERLYPLLVALGVAGEGATAERLNDGWAFASQT